jgi:hypothetical protein
VGGPRTEDEGVRPATGGVDEAKLLEAVGGTLEPDAELTAEAGEDEVLSVEVFETEEEGVVTFEMGVVGKPLGA